VASEIDRNISQVSETKEELIYSHSEAHKLVNTRNRFKCT